MAGNGSVARGGERCTSLLGLCMARRPGACAPRAGRPGTGPGPPRAGFRGRLRRCRASVRIGRRRGRRGGRGGPARHGCDPAQRGAERGVGRGVPRRSRRAARRLGSRAVRRRLLRGAVWPGACCPGCAGLRSRRKSGSPIPGRAYLPATGLEPLAAYDVPTSLDLEDRTMRRTMVYRLLPEEGYTISPQHPPKARS